MHLVSAAFFYTKKSNMCVVGKVTSSVDDPDQQVTRASACLLEVI